MSPSPKSLFYLYAIYTIPNTIVKIAKTIANITVHLFCFPSFVLLLFFSKKLLVDEPVIVEDSDNLIVFPTTSPRSEDCIWISLKRVKSFEKIDHVNTKVIFDNNREIIVPVSYRTLENQISRASRLDFMMRKRKTNL